jgi:tRNA U34 5-methylaminomethyl-2-thiouridine-forming methyltransferase MnmC
VDEHLQIITTADGSRSLLNTALNETYHSQHGALQESQHVFIEQGLKFFLSSSKQSDVRILEVGFGTGLNAYLTLLESAKYQAQMIYTSLETFPLKKEVWSQLNYASMEPVNKFTALHDALWKG